MSNPELSELANSIADAIKAQWIEKAAAALAETKAFPGDTARVTAALVVEALPEPPEVSATTAVFLDRERDLRAENAALAARLAEAESHLAAMLNAGREASAALAQMGWASSELSDTAFAAAAYLAKQGG